MQVYKINIEWSKSVRNHYQTIEVKAEDIAALIVKVGNYCEVLLGTMPKNIYELRWEIDGVGQGHYVTDWSRVLKPEPKPFILASTFYYEEDKHLHEEGKAYTYVCWLPDGIANSDTNIYFNSLEEVRKAWEFAPIDYMTKYVKINH